MQVKARIGSYVVYEPPEEGWENWLENFQKINNLLKGAGLEVIEAPEPAKDPDSCQRIAQWAEQSNLDLLHALIITWSFDHYTILIQQRARLPIVIRSIPGIRSGSLVGGEQLSCVLSDLDVEHKLFFGKVESPEVIEQIKVYAQACMLRKRLQGANIAVIGRRTEGMTPTAVDEIEILRLFGCRLLHFGLEELEPWREKIPIQDAQQSWENISTHASQVLSRGDQGVETCRTLLALQRMITTLNLSAITIGSYPQCQGTMCVPIAMLNNQGFPTGCEGDVNSTLAMLILSMLVDQPVHFGEMLEVDEDANMIISSHCGCGSPSLADEKGYLLCPVRLANDGVCVRFSARSGPVTYANLVGRKGNYRLCAFEGQAIPTSLVFEGNPLKFITKTPFRTIWKEIVEHGFGHHWMTAYAHVVPTLAEFCQLCKIKGVFPDLAIERG